MSSVELSDFEKQILPECEFIWDKGVLMNAPLIFKECTTKEKLREFIAECEHNIRNRPKECKIMYNGEVQKFGGEKYEYVWLFKSFTIKEVVKIALKIDGIEKAIVVGYMAVSGKKEENKLYVHQALVEQKTEGGQ